MRIFWIHDHGSVAAATTDQRINRIKRGSELNEFNIGNKVFNVAAADFNNAVPSIYDFEIISTAICNQQHIVAVTTIDNIVAIDGNKPIVAVATVQDVVAAQTNQGVIAAESINRVA